MYLPAGGWGAWVLAYNGLGKSEVWKRTRYNLSSIQNAYRLTYTERKSHAMRIISRRNSVVQHFFIFIPDNIRTTFLLSFTEHCNR